MRISDWSSDVCSSDLPVIATICTLSRATNVPRCSPSLLSGLAETWWNSSTAINRSSNAPTPNLSTAKRKVAWVQTKTLSVLARKLPTELTFPPSSPGASHKFHFGSTRQRSEEHTSELQSLMRISYAVSCLKKKHKTHKT